MSPVAKIFTFSRFEYPTTYRIALTAVYENDCTASVFLHPWYFIIVLVSFSSAPFTHRDQGFVRDYPTAPDFSCVPENHRFHTGVQSLFHRIYGSAAKTSRLTIWADQNGMFFFVDSFTGLTYIERRNKFQSSSMVWLPNPQPVPCSTLSICYPNFFFLS